MFGWFKSLIGMEPVQETVVPPKVKKVAKKAEKPVTKKAASKVKAAKTVKAPAKKKEVVTPVVDPAPKKKGGRPKKTAVAAPAQTEQSSPNS
jgi:uncharacterized protein YcgI (DUF1989 family)